ncbi:hypothetical protein GmHk_11G032720 [Glycine max]|nr:hypothetical protein GmHk_11G032720 [Glycine max]
MYKDKWTQPWPIGSKIYPEVHENPRAFFSSSSPILLEPLAHDSDPSCKPKLNLNNIIVTTYSENQNPNNPSLNPRLLCKASPLAASRASISKLALWCTCYGILYFCRAKRAEAVLSDGCTLSLNGELSTTATFSTSRLNLF